MKYLISFACTMFFAASAFAAGAAGGSASGLVGSAALTGGLGKMSNKDKSIPDIDMTFAELTADAGYAFGIFAPLVQLSYRYVGQRTKASKVSDINVSGQGYLLGLGLSARFTQIGFSAIYNMTGKYDLAKESGGGSKISYTAPEGFHILGKYNYGGPWQFVVSYSSVDYKEKKTGSTTTKIDDNPLKQTLYGVGVGYAF